MWGLVFLTFALIIENRVMAWLAPDNPNLTYGIQLITACLAALVGNSFIRQTGKNKTLLANKEIKMAIIENETENNIQEEIDTVEDVEDFGFDSISTELDIDKIK